jgi:elongation factor 2 kinase
MFHLLSLPHPPHPSRSQDWREAVKWYFKVLENGHTTATDPSSSPFDEPNYTILAKIAQKYAEGGYNLEKDPQKAGDLYTEAAESAMSAMKGKLSSKYYMLAEEAWGEVDDG